MKKGYKVFSFLMAVSLSLIMIYSFLKFEPVTEEYIILKVAGYDLGSEYKLVEANRAPRVLKWLDSYSESYIFKISNFEITRLFKRIENSGLWKLQPHYGPSVKGGDVWYERIFYLDGEGHLVIARAGLNDQVLKIYIYSK